MLYNLPNGMTIELSVQQALDMTDEDIEYLVAYNWGEPIENPWHGSTLTKVGKQIFDEDEEFTPELTDLSSVQKLEDLDIDPSNLE